MVRKSMVLAACACAAMAPVMLSAQAPGSIESDLAYGRDYLKSGNAAGAATYFRQAVMLHPDHAEANLLLAVALQRSGKTEEARPYFDKALRLDRSFADRPEVQKFAGELGTPPARDDSLFPAATEPARRSVPAAGGEEAIGSAGYFLNYARYHLKNFNFDGAADYARQALAVDPGNEDARRILRDAGAKRAPADAPRGDPNQVGTPAYFLKYARYHLENGNGPAASKYAREALGVDPSSSEAKQILAQAGRIKPKPAPKGGKALCESQFSTCWSSSTTYTPGSGYSADNARRAQCFVERNICQGGS